MRRGGKSIRGAPRATVQQLYGQTYDLEALALELDATHIDDIDPGGFDRNYSQGKRFAVGDLGRKLLLVVVREKLEVNQYLTIHHNYTKYNIYIYIYIYLFMFVCLFVYLFTYLFI